MTATVPLVSVIIAACNAEPYIAKAIESARAQSLAEIEIIVVDDGSRDGTARVAEELAALDERVIVIRLAVNRGVSAARNAGLKVARGDWLAVLDADDEFAPRRLEILLGHAARLRADMVADNLAMHEFASGAPMGMALPDAWMLQDRDIDLAYMLERDIPGVYEREFGYLKPVIRREILSANGIWYHEDIYAAEDFMLYAECVLSGAKFRLVPEALYLYAVRTGSLSSKKTSNLSCKKVSEILLRRLAPAPALDAALLRLRLHATNYELFAWHAKAGRPLAALRVMADIPLWFTWSRLKAVALGRLGIRVDHPTVRHLESIRRQTVPLQAG